MQWASKLFGMGLLDPELEKRLSDAQRRQMGQASLMDAGIAMLANSGYSRMPVSTGQALAAGIGAGRQSYAGQAQGLQEQMAAQQKAQAEQQQRAQILQGLDPELRQFAQGLALPQLMDVAKQAAGERSKAMNRAPQTSTLQREAAQLFPNDQAAQNNWIRQQRAKSNAPVVNVNTGNPSAGMDRIITPEQKRVMGLPDNGTYVWDKNGMPQLVEGTGPGTPQAKADVEKAKLAPKAAASLQAAEARAERILGAIDQAISATGLFTAGPGEMLSGVPGTAARDLRATLDTVKANVGFDELNQMRQNSPTGGALGNVTERELAFLQAVLGSLDQGQSPAQLRQKLTEVSEQVRASMGRLRAAYVKEFGGAAEDDEALINKYLGN